MGYRETDIKLPTDFDPQQLRNKIKKELRIGNFTYEILSQSLDARNKSNIFWQLRIGVHSPELRGANLPEEPSLQIPFRGKGRKAVVTGSGPAGFFSAFVLQQAGFSVTILERGTDVTARDRGITRFETSGEFDPKSNYAFGEGGAGTFSDGKLTSRSKHISVEKKYILDQYIKAGAPEEIGYLTHPHVGSDNLKTVVQNLRREFQDMGGTILFETLLTDFRIRGARIVAAVSDQGIHEADLFIVAPGHSSYETYRMLMANGIPFRTKNFALGFRAEHSQEVINLGQWGRTSLPGVKAAEYRLTSNREGRLPVFSFCMCPGGIVVPAAAYADCNIVNGMSYYQRDGRFANAACVAGVHPSVLASRELSPLEALNYVQQLETSFYTFSGGFQAPSCSIRDFLRKRSSQPPKETSYPLGLVEAPLWEMLPEVVIHSLTEGLEDFSRKLKGYETGNLLGLESKTSSPVQVVRDETGKAEGFDNLFVVGEGSGYAGGIISSGADGIRAAVRIVS